MRLSVVALALVMLAGCASSRPPPDIDGLWVLTEATIGGEPAQAPDGLRTVIEVRGTDLVGWSAPCAPMHGSLRDVRGSWEPEFGGTANLVGCVGRDWRADFAEAFNATTFVGKDPDNMLFGGNGSEFGFERLDPIDPAFFGVEWRFVSWSLPDVADELELGDFSATLRLDTIWPPGWSPSPATSATSAWASTRSRRERPAPPGIDVVVDELTAPR